MKLFLTLLLICMLGNGGYGQPLTKASAKKEFLHALNEIVSYSSTIHWGYEGKMTIDSPFAISSKGILSVTVRYKTDTSTFRVRFEAPVNKIWKPFIDIYMILCYKEKDVSLYYAEGDGKLELKGKTTFFHTGEANDETSVEKMDVLIKNIKRFYPKE